MHAHVCNIPHPEKADKGGEDAFYVSKDNRAIGVFDGVGGWVMHGVDPAIYATKLASGVKHAYEDLHITNPQEALSVAYEGAKSIEGSSTAVCAVLQEDSSQLMCSNVGDSGMMIIRDGRVLFKTKEQQHIFNFPLQLGTGHTTNPKEHADNSVLTVKDGDIIIMASDGLFDNLYDHQIVELTQIFSEYHQQQARLRHSQQQHSPSHSEHAAAGTSPLHHVLYSPHSPQHSPTHAPISFDDEFAVRDRHLLAMFQSIPTKGNLAECLAQVAHKQAASSHETPFARHAFQLGYLDSPYGGKMDDITVVV